MASKIDTTLGFYTVQHDEAAGWIGGYLLLNTNGRPLEFHCSLPLRPTRTQEVLYGPSLEPFLVGDLIGRAVIQRARLSAKVVLTDKPEALEFAPWINIPIACVTDACDDSERTIEVDGCTLATSPGHQSTVAAALREMPATLDLTEPFDRIREAFGEAKGTTRAAA